MQIILLPVADIDECALLQHECTQGCTNTEGSYNCTCGPGYELWTDGFTCDESK